MAERTLIESLEAYPIESPFLKSENVAGWKAAAGSPELTETIITEIRQIYGWMAAIAHRIEAVQANLEVVAARAELIAVRAGQQG